MRIDEARRIFLSRLNLATNARAKFERELAKWLEANPSFFRRFADSILNGFKLLRLVKFRWLSLPYHFGSLALAASGPVIAYETSGQLSLSEAVLYFVVILVVLLASQGLNSWSQANSKRVSGPLQTIWVRIGDLLGTVKSSATAVKAKDRSIEATLSIAASLSAEVVKVPSDRIGASLVQYNGTGFGKMKVTHRNRGSERPCPRQVKDISTLLGHHACQNEAAPRVVPDIRRFGPLGLKSPTQTAPGYRSIFIQPLTSTSSGQIKGFISIDCTVAHAFHGRKADDLVALLEPIKSHIEDMI